MYTLIKGGQKEAVPDFNKQFWETRHYPGISYSLIWYPSP